MISDLDSMGYSSREIAEKLRISHATVSRDLKTIDRRWQDKYLNNEAKNKIKAEAIERTYKREKEAWQGWDRSQQQRRVKSVEYEPEIALPDGKTLKGKQKVSERVEDQYGDPRFLEQASKAVQQRCDLLGLIVQKTDNTHHIIDNLTEEFAKALEVLDEESRRKAIDQLRRRDSR